MATKPKNYQRYFEHVERFHCEVKMSVRGFQRSSKGYAIAHHGELLQGEFEDDGVFVRALATLPLPNLTSTAIFSQNGTDKLNVCPENFQKAKKAAEKTIEILKLPPGGDLVIESSIPIGKGYGSSTADIAAAINALTNYYGITIKPKIFAQIALEAETASDSTIYNSIPMLYAQRLGKPLEIFGLELPDFALLSIDSDPTGYVFTEKMELPIYSQFEKDKFKLLRSALHIAVKTANIEMIGNIATESSEINQKYLPKKNWSIIKEIKEKSSALGIQVAHSGTLVGLIYDKRNILFKNNIQLAIDLFQDKLSFEAIPYFE
ncbi:hypothetical protein NHB29_22505 (plasmid) [Pantoea agglomerans]|uniref:GHMP family kinase ATP-binding protein n=1 Tax=Enterobacter agglomerans TaxID=549 RepID=UPI00273A5DEF|nr:hypothetical protein [Pantoea agglomerans]WLO87192.1 hypothetical protein NHB29_22505 [Pantoea agglomerans]